MKKTKEEYWEEIDHPDCVSFDVENVDRAGEILGELGFNIVGEHETDTHILQAYYHDNRTLVLLVGENGSAWINPTDTCLNEPYVPDEFREKVEEKVSFLQKAECWFRKGEELYEKGLYNEAIETYEKAIEINPDFHVALYCKGAALDVLNRREEAIEAYNKAIELKPDKHLYWISKGYSHFAIGQYKEAVEAFSKYKEKETENPALWSHMGIALRKLGLHKDAIEALNKAIKLDPDDYDVSYSLWISLSASGRHEEALKALIMAKEEDPGDSKFYYNKACAYFLKEDKTNTLEYLERAVDYGFDDLSLIEKDSNLDFIRGDEKFKAIVSIITDRQCQMKQKNRSINMTEENFTDLQKVLISLKNFLNGNSDENIQFAHELLSKVLEENGPSFGIVPNDEGRHEEALEAYNRAKELEKK